MKRKVLAMVMTVAMTVGLLTGCGGGTESQTPSTDNAAATQQSDAGSTKEASDAGSTATANESELTTEQIELTVWHIGIEETRHQCITNAIARFEAEHPNIKVVEVANENDPYKTKLSTAMAAGEEPDIFVSWGGGWLQSFIDEGKVLDIDDWVNEISDEYYESALKLFQVNGKNYSLPYSCGPVPVYYNKQIYADLGLEIPETLEELEANCEKIKEAGILPFALGNAAQWPGALTFSYLSMRYGGTEPFLDAYNRVDGATFEDESFILAGAKIQEWVEKGYYPEGANGINYDTGGSRMLFYNGMAAHIVQTNGMFSNCSSEAPEFYENNLAVFPFPSIEGGKGDKTQLLGGGNAYSISASCEYPREAFELIHALTDKNYGQDSVDIAGMISGVKGVTISNPLTQQAQDLISNATYIQNFYDQFLPAEVATAHKQTTYDLFGLTTTPEQAAKDVEEAAKAALK